MPKTMPRMTKEGEERLRTALDDVVDLVNDGKDPDDAIVKVATDRSIPPGHVSLMVAAYNTGRTTRHRESHSSLLEKSADFPIADAPSILDRLYPSRVKSAAAIEHESGVHITYSLSPGWYTRATRESGMEKAAAATDWRMVDKSVPLYPTVHDEETGERIKTARQKAGQAEDQDRMEAARIQNQIMAGFAKLADYFATPGSLVLADIRENVETLFGKEGVAVINQLRRTRPNLVKQAATGRFHSTMGEPYSTVSRLVDLAGRLHHVVAGNEKRAADRTAALEVAERPFFVPAQRVSLLDPLPLPGTEKAADDSFWPNFNALIARDYTEPMMSHLAPTDKDKLVEKQLRAIGTPEHEQQLRDVQTRAMLEDMLSHDPVISGHHRDEVLGAFNDVSQLAPRASQQPLLMNALLRKRLQQGSIDPFEVGDLVKTEQGLSDIGTIPDTTNGGAPGEKSDTIIQRTGLTGTRRKPPTFLPVRLSPAVLWVGSSRRPRAVRPSG